MNDVYYQALAGGMIIGAGAILLMLSLGKIAGISGITHAAITSSSSKNGWRWAFLLGLFIAPILIAPAGFSLPDSLPVGHGVLVIAGLLVGVGTRLGSGCTSGHGICGLSRLSLRSVVATTTFILVAIVTVTITRHLI